MYRDAEQELGKMEQLTAETMWRAVITNNQSFDGIFYYGVSSTGIFCRPSCKSKVPKRQNVVFFFEPGQAMAEGYHPCKRCRPDLKGPFLEPMEEIITRITDIFRTEYSDSRLLEVLPVRVGVSASHLQRTFKKHTGFTPKEFLQNLRIQKAQELLVVSEMDNIGVCYAVGFRSLSCFYAAFRMKTGISPRKYRIKNYQSSNLGGIDTIGI
jgi:AraC family transcriptional regulator of adaptative response / methylphosphotriester-DNA alkyltransferase methyltransferase